MGGPSRSALSRALRPVTERRYHPGMSEPDFQPTLTGPTVIVRPVTSGDWAGVVRCRLRSGNLEGASPFRSLHRAGV